MAQSRYIRPVDDAEAVNIGIPKYRAQTLFDNPAGLFLAITIAEGGCGPGLHYHQSDQIYFLTRGSIKIQLGQELHHVDAKSLIFIPAGLPHYNWNDGTGSEAHLEMQFPSPQRFGQLGYQIDRAEDVPEEWKTSRKGYILRIEEAQIADLGPNVRTSRLADLSLGSPNVQIDYSKFRPHDPAYPTRIHVFDQYYYVLEGELTFEIALSEGIAKADTLVVIPAGVPYRQYNAGAVAASHLTISVPPPRPDSAPDIEVTVTRTST